MFEESKGWFIEQNKFGLYENKTKEMKCSLSRINSPKLEEVKLLGVVDTRSNVDMEDSLMSV